MSQSSGEPAGWYVDPARAAAWRWWDGQAWTVHTSGPVPGSYPALPPPTAYGYGYGYGATLTAAPPDPRLGPPYAGGSEAHRDAALEWLVPVGRTPLSIAAGYAGIVGLFLLFVAPVAMVLGVLALRGLRGSTAGGRGRAWFGVIAGCLGSGVLAILLATDSYHPPWELMAGTRTTTSQTTVAAAPATTWTSPPPQDGTPVFLAQDPPMPDHGRLVVEGGHGMGLAQSPVFALPAGPTHRVGVVLDSVQGDVRVTIVDATSLHRTVLLGSCDLTCHDHEVVLPGTLPPGRYHVVIEAGSITYWSFEVFVR